MQVRQSQLRRGRPVCCRDARHPVDLHARYSRYARADGQEREVILRFICRPCRYTISVLPDHRLPYVPVHTAQVQDHFDAQAQGVAPPPATENEKGCLKRAWRRFTGRADALASRLGQLMQCANPAARQVWTSLRALGNLAASLHLLSEGFHTSLLKDYLCLRPRPDLSG